MTSQGQLRIKDLQTPALLIEAAVLEENIAAMSAALPGPRLRPHVKAHKCTNLARRQAVAGHEGFTCATIRECERMTAAGLGQDLLLANEVLDARRLGALVADGSRITLAVDSPQTIEAAAKGGVREVVIDVNVGLPRCGCDPGEAGQLAEAARKAGLEVRGVMGYEGHVVGLTDAQERAAQTKTAMEMLVAAHADVGGELVSAGGTGTYLVNTWASEIQAGSYALMDTAYGKLGLPFGQALFVLGTVISTSPEWSVADAGLKAFGMDHGNPDLEGATVWFCSDEHTTFSDPRPVGDKVRFAPAHIDPTMAYHERAYVCSGDEIVDVWPIDMRGW
ncbi:MAG TPA: alanine racemase [Streptosporangiaceae bacterium]|jgi:D-serine deaminase-like pyridoxal phosphate-dependent protein|nr:alanine racemase [Streptosporangiaceae bacterium]